MKNKKCGLSDSQKNILNLIKDIWENNYDLRFPQIIEVISSTLIDCKTIDEIVNKLSKMKEGIL